MSADLPLAERLLEHVALTPAPGGGWWAEGCGERAYGRTQLAAVAALAEFLR